MLLCSSPHLEDGDELGIDPHGHFWLMGSFRVRGVTASRIPHTSSERLRQELPRGRRRMGDHPVFRYPVFRERCYRVGWVRRPSVGGAGFLVRPGDLVKRRVAPLLRGTALTSGSAGRRHGESTSWLGDTAPFVAVGLRRPLSSTLCRRLLRPLSRSCPSTGCGCYGSLGRKQEVFARKFENAMEAGIEAVWRPFGRGRERGPRVRGGAAARKSDRTGQGSLRGRNGDRPAMDHVSVTPRRRGGLCRGA
jgi:hypothetical protein